MTVTNNKIATVLLLNGNLRKREKLIIIMKFHPRTIFITDSNYYVASTS